MYRRIFFTSRRRFDIHANDSREPEDISPSPSVSERLSGIRYCPLSSRGYGKKKKKKENQRGMPLARIFDIRCSWRLFELCCCRRRPCPQNTIQRLVYTRIFSVRKTHNVLSRQLIYTEDIYFFFRFNNGEYKFEYYTSVI